LHRHLRTHYLQQRKTSNVKVDASIEKSITFVDDIACVVNSVNACEVVSFDIIIGDVIYINPDLNTDEGMFITSMLSYVKDLSLQTLPSLSVSQSLYTELINSVHGSIGVSSQTTTQELTTIITTSDGGIIPDEGNDRGL
jgi:hypothetical protein